MTLTLWPTSPAPRTVTDVPKLRPEDRQFADRLGRVLVELRRRTGENRDEAAERMELNSGTLGRWERGNYAPKGYDLGRLFRGYSHVGARWEWFFDPPEVVEVNPIRSHLDELERTGAISADEREARVAARRREAVAKRAAARGKPTKRSRPRPPR